MGLDTVIWQRLLESYVIEWDASEVLSSFTFSLTDDAGGRFAIDSSTGEITVVDGSLIDYETATSHNVDVQVTDAAGNSYSETMSITIDNGLEAIQTVPAAQTIDEDTTLTFTSGTATEVSVTDTVGTTDSRMRVTLSVNDGVLTLSQTTGLTIVEGANGSGSLVIDGTESDINAALNGMTFTPDANFNGSVTLDMSTSLSADLDAHYTFGSGTVSGLTLSDQAAGTAYDGFLNGNATIVSDAQRGDVLSLDGDNDFVYIENLLGQPANVTLSGWINANSLDTFGGVLISLGYQPGDLPEQRGATGRLLRIRRHRLICITGTENLVGTGWRHVALTIDDTTNEMSVYLDGELIGTMTGNGPIEYDNSPDSYIGRSGDGTSGFDFNGLIDDARVYSRALSADEIAAIADEQVVGSGPAETIGPDLTQTFDATGGDNTATNLLFIHDDFGGITSTGTISSLQIGTRQR